MAAVHGGVQFGKERLERGQSHLLLILYVQSHVPRFS